MSTKKSTSNNEKMKKKYFNSIEEIFKLSGFTSLPVEGEYFNITGRPNCELDHCFILENIIIICEQTTGKKDTDHLLKKQETANIITKNDSTKTEFLDFLSEKFNNFKNKFEINRWKIFYLYFSKNQIDFDSKDKERYNKLKFIDTETFNYFSTMSKCIKKSFKYEILRFLDIKKEDYGEISSSDSSSSHNVSIIYPNDVTGLKNGVGVVSFMMSPEKLIETSYVLRKDSWGDNIGLYQRLLTEKRIKKIRKFVIDKKKTFFNNIIVGLPDSTKIYNEDGKEINVSQLSKYQNCKMSITQDFNTISIIDGQHRIYAYYENNISDTDEEEVAKLRNKLNLLVTGLLFPKEWNEWEKQKFQSEIFLQINRNSKNIEKDVIFHIESTMDPLSSSSIARMIIKKMNEKDPFKDKFELSLVKKSQIKVSSIIQFALSSLVSGNKNSQGFFKYWNPEHSEKPESLNTDLLEEYVAYCSTQLQQYFNAIKDIYKTDWDNLKSYLLKITSINGFIIALNESLKLTDGPKDFKFYKELFSSKNFNFSKGKFPYSGSKYKQFAIEMILPLFYKKCEEKYIELMNLTIGEQIFFKENKSIVATLSQNNKFSYNEKLFSLYDLTKKIKEDEKLNNIPEDYISGNYWELNSGTLLHELYEKNSK